MNRKEAQDEGAIVSVVREKASHRKVRTNEPMRSARVPAQERSRKRYEAVLDATVKLLETTNIEDISLHDIGKACELPAASVHYLFSTVSAIHLELSRRFNDEMTEKIIVKTRSLGMAHVNTWQEMIRAAMVLAKDELNSSRALSEVILAPVLHRSVRAISFQTNSAFGAASMDLYKEFFILPDIPRLDSYFVLSTELAEGIWAGSYARHGRIDDFSFEESVRAVIAYLRCFLPETLTARE
ncbi:hypothetical protein [Pseudomonas veronii]|uniref:hypothetical protein n=1 Tax=Pseudomonas veronii TaxID=76761 RepID=UPI0021C07FD5|nr:hypothetical protein [Pseudomonas veronii]MCT9826627.1 hypothetical protein [Pseudomonas veronii]